MVLVSREPINLERFAVTAEAPHGTGVVSMRRIHYTAALEGQASASGRLDPPLLMGLDEVTQICPVPLPAWLSDSGGKGIQVLPKRVSRRHWRRTRRARRRLSCFAPSAS